MRAFRRLRRLRAREVRPQPDRDAQPFAIDVPRVRVAGGVGGIPVRQESQHCATMQPQPRRQVRGRVRRAMPQPRGIGRVRGQVDPCPPKGCQRGVFVGVRGSQFPPAVAGVRGRVYTVNVYRIRVAGIFRGISVGVDTVDG